MNASPLCHNFVHKSQSVKDWVVSTNAYNRGLYRLWCDGYTKSQKIWGVLEGSFAAK